MLLDDDDVRRLIAAGEGARIEFKRGLPRASKVARTLAAFANTRGGHLLVGVDDRGRVIGALRPRATTAELRAIARDHVDPPPELNVQGVRLDGHPVIVVTVGLSPRRPHAVQREDGEVEFPVRIGSSTRAARGPALEALRLGAAADGTAGLRPLERQILEWISGQGDAGTGAAARCTPEAFARACNVGRVRARRTFLRLERAGRLIGHGSGAQRVYGRP